MKRRAKPTARDLRLWLHLIAKAERDGDALIKLSEFSQPMQKWIFEDFNKRTKRKAELVWV